MRAENSLPDVEKWWQPDVTDCHFRNCYSAGNELAPHRRYYILNSYFDGKIIAFQRFCIYLSKYHSLVSYPQNKR